MKKADRRMLIVAEGDKLFKEAGDRIAGLRPNDHHEWAKLAIEKNSGYRLALQDILMVLTDKGLL